MTHDLTDRSAAVASSSSAVLLQMADGSIAACNAAAEQILGYASAQLIGKRLGDLFGQANGSAVDPTIAALRTGQHSQVAIDFLHPNGQQIRLKLDAQPLFQANETVPYAVVTTIALPDTTPFVESSGHCEDNLRQFIQYAPVSLAMFDREMRYVAASDRWIAVHQLESVEAIVGRSHYDVFLPMPDNWPQIHQRGLAGEILKCDEDCFVGTDGAKHWLRWEVQPWRTDRGEIGGIIILAEDISDRKQAELTLRDSEARFRNMADHAPFMVWVTDPTGYCHYLSQSWYEFSGQTPEVGLGFGWLDAVHPDDRAASKAIFLAANERQEAFRLEYRLRRSDGEYIWAIDAATPWFGADGQYKGYVGSVIDISDRKRAEEELRQSQAIAQQQLLEIEAIYQTAPIGLAIVDADLRFQRINEHLAEINGIAVDDHLGRSVREIVPALADAVEPLFRQVIETGEPLLDLELSGETKAQPGVERTWIENWYPLKDANGQAIAINAVIQEITDRKTAELEREQHLANERRYTEQLQGLTTASLAINSALSVQEVLQEITDRAAAIVGAHQSVTSLTIGQNWTQAITATCLSDKYAQWRDYNEPTDGTGIYACVCRLNRSLRMTQSELEAHPDWHGFGKAAGKHPPMRGWLAAPLVGRDGQNIGLIQLSDKHEGDFTAADEAVLVQLAQMASIALENARLYEAEQQARESAQTANRIKDEFLAVLSHELRSPLNPILGWTRLLQTRQFSASKTAEALATIERNARLQAQLIEDLLDISRIMRGKLTLNSAPVSLASVITAAIETVRLAAEAKNLQIVLMLDRSVDSVLGDAGRLQQVLWNLLSNAVKFTPNGGRIEVRLAGVSGIGESVPARHDQGLGVREQPNPNPQSLAPNPSIARLTISDTGKGIHPDFLPHVFEYFRQEDGSTTRKFGGLGLGLAIARQIVELHGGTIAAESAGEGQGATFTVRLPLFRVEPPVPEAIASSTSTAAAPLADVRVLVVDDAEDSRELLMVLLEANGAIVLAASSAIEALQMMQQFQPEILLSDIGMPEMDGYELMRAIRALESSTEKPLTAIALTAYAAEFDRQQALDAGFQHHLAKPIDPDQVIAAILELVRFDRKQTRDRSIRQRD